MTQKNISYTIFLVNIFFINYNKTHKSRLKCGNKNDLYKIVHQNKKAKILKFL